MRIKCKSLFTKYRHLSFTFRILNFRLIQLFWYGLTLYRYFTTRSKALLCKIYLPIMINIPLISFAVTFGQTSCLLNLIHTAHTKTLLIPLQRLRQFSLKHICDHSHIPEVWELPGECCMLTWGYLYWMWMLLCTFWIKQ